MNEGKTLDKVVGKQIYREKSNMETQRQRDARMAELYARTVWFAFHIAVILLITLPDTVLRHNLQSNQFRQFVPFFGVVLVTLVLYLAVGFTNPGYVEATWEDQERYSNKKQNQTEYVNQNRQVKQANGTFIRECKSPEREIQVYSSTTHDESSVHEEQLDEVRLIAGGEYSHIVSNNDVERGSSSGGDSNWWLGKNPGKVCNYCGVWQPLRAKHCHDCNRCVRKFDHHCAFVGNCVGAGNHVIFWWYLLWQMAELLWALQIIVASLDGRADRELSTFYLPLIAAALIILFFSLFASVIFFYHTYLLLVNDTTYERERWNHISYLQGVPENVHLFSYGPFRNIWLFCCRPNYKYTIADDKVQKLIEESQRETFWNNLYYSCF